MEDRGFLDKWIDEYKKELAINAYKEYKPRGATKDHIVWFCKGSIYGAFETYFLMKYRRILDDSEHSEVIEVIERRTNEIADVLTEYQDKE